MAKFVGNCDRCKKQNCDVFYVEELIHDKICFECYSEIVNDLKKGVNKFFAWFAKPTEEKIEYLK